MSALNALPCARAFVFYPYLPSVWRCIAPVGAQAWPPSAVAGEPLPVALASPAMCQFPLRVWTECRLVTSSLSPTLQEVKEVVRTLLGSSIHTLHQLPKKIINYQFINVGPILALKWPFESK